MLIGGQIKSKYHTDIKFPSQYEPQFTKFVYKLTKNKNLRDAILIDQVSLQGTEAHGYQWNVHFS